MKQGLGMESAAAQYGPWALIAGASEGVGAAVARLLGELAIHVVLVSRNKAALDELGASLKSQARPLVCDLNRPDAADVLIEGTNDLDIGLMIYNTGAPGCVPPRSFLGSEAAHWQDIVSRNAMTVTALCHHFGSRMTARGRGGIVLIGSTAAWAGTENMAIYCATKAFQRGLAESLWAEWRDLGVDVLGMMLGPTDTPALRRLLGESRAEGAADCDMLAGEMLAGLGREPIWPAGPDPFSGISRKDAVLRRAEMRAGMFEDAHPAEGGRMGR